MLSNRTTKALGIPMTQTLPAPHIIITGASSGIGAGMALHYAAPGVRLGLTGRNETRLEEIAAACRAQGATVTTAAVDVTDAGMMEFWLHAQDDKQPVTLLIANAGISGGTSAGVDGGAAEETSNAAEAIFATNVQGVLRSVYPLIPRMRARKSGQIGIVSSLAGFRGLPGAPAYSASKMAVRGWGEALRGWLAHDGIRVSVICPGYVKSRITEKNNFPMPGLIDAPEAASIIARGLEKNRSRIVFPWWFAFACWLLGSLPPCLTDWLYARLPKK